MVWSNAMLYNRPNSGIWNAAKSLQTLWKHKFHNIKQGSAAEPNLTSAEPMSLDSPHSYRKVWNIQPTENTRVFWKDSVGSEKQSDTGGGTPRNISSLASTGPSHFRNSPGREGHDLADSLVPGDLKELTKQHLKHFKRGKGSPRHLIKKYWDQLNSSRPKSKHTEQHTVVKPDNSKKIMDLSLYEQQTTMGSLIKTRVI